MCGIFGYVGTRQAKDVIIKGLKLLEYRGYDSAGAAFFHDEKISVYKKIGRISVLEESLNSENFLSGIGIGHMRWATHGRPSNENSHPFLSCGGKFAVVHNGIIENYLDLKKELENAGYVFHSQTDSEVIPNLIEYLYKGNTKEAILAALKKLRGSFALGILSVYDKDTIFAVKKDSPLVLGLGGGENFVCSDTNTLQNFAGNVIVLKNEQMAVVKENKITVCDFRGREVKYKIDAVKMKKEETLSNPHPHMYREMQEIPEVLSETYEYFRKNDIFKKVDKEFLRKVNRIHIVGCGTALHAGLVGKSLFRKYCKLDVFSEYASEFKHENYIIDQNTLVIAVSQSGETADTISAVKKAREAGGKVLSITNVPTSSIVSESNFVISTFAGPEIAVASTKAYNCQLMTIFVLVLNFALVRGELSKNDYDILFAELGKIPKAAEKTLETAIQSEQLAHKNFSVKSVFYLGRGIDFFVAQEGSLKLKEISYISSEAYAGGELKHGTLALIEEGVLVISPVTQSELLNKNCGSLSEVKTRGARVITITPFKSNSALKQVSDNIIAIPAVHEDFASVLAVIPMQFFAYYMALHRGCDVDKPRNLAKSVTVE